MWEEVSLLVDLAQFLLLKVSHAVIMDTEFAIRLEDGELDIGLTKKQLNPTVV